MTEHIGVINAADSILLALYGAPKSTASLDTDRLHCFTKAVAKCPIHTQMQLVTLPPTSTAAKEQSLRVYYSHLDQNKDGLFKLLATSIHEFVPPLGKQVISTHGQDGLSSTIMWFVRFTLYSRSGRYLATPACFHTSLLVDIQKM